MQKHVEKDSLFIIHIVNKYLIFTVSFKKKINIKNERMIENFKKITVLIILGSFLY